MAERQDIEYKQSWRDEYLKWICGFANAQGGVIYIGIDDKGRVCGIDNADRLMEDIPNKVRDLMGIVVDVNRYSRNGLDYLAIVTDPYPYPISLHGQYHYRSGSTKQELKGAALDRFMMRKIGKSWDAVPLPHVGVGDLDTRTLDDFRRYAKRSSRMGEADLMDDNAGLLDKLRLTEGRYLKRAAALLFHPDPERFVSGAYIKIGYFREHAALLYQDEVHGNLFQQSKGALDLLTTKYMNAYISYEGIHRVETLPVPREALREALLNAIVHKTYESCTPIQIAVFDDRIEFWNTGVLPEGWTIDDFLRPHRSSPYNPDIAHAFFRAGEIESWGRGIERMVRACKDAGCPEPEFRFDGTGMWQVFHKKAANLDPNEKTDTKTTPKTNLKTSPKTNPKTSLKTNPKTTLIQDKILNIIINNPNITRDELVSSIPNATLYSIKYHLARLTKLGLLRRVGSSRSGHWEVTDGDTKVEIK